MGFNKFDSERFTNSIFEDISNHPMTLDRRKANKDHEHIRQVLRRNIKKREKETIVPEELLGIIFQDDNALEYVPENLKEIALGICNYRDYYPNNPTIEIVSQRWYEAAKSIFPEKLKELIGDVKIINAIYRIPDVRAMTRYRGNSSLIGVDFRLFQLLHNLVGPLFVGPLHGIVAEKSWVDIYNEFTDYNCNNTPLPSIRELTDYSECILLYCEMFLIFHELGHVLTHSAHDNTGAAFPIDDRETCKYSEEVFCDAFASKALEIFAFHHLNSSRSPFEQKKSNQHTKIYVWVALTFLFNCIFLFQKLHIYKGVRPDYNHLAPFKRAFTCGVPRDFLLANTRENTDLGVIRQITEIFDIVGIRIENDRLSGEISFIHKNYIQKRVWEMNIEQLPSDQNEIIREFIFEHIVDFDTRNCFINFLRLSDV